VQEEQIHVEAQASRQEIVVERIPIDLFVDRPEGIRREGDTLIVPVFEEVPVVITKIKLKEEVRITTRTHAERRPTPVSVRREQVSVERIPAHSHNQATAKDKKGEPR